jgi:hypothetical protein
MEWRDTDWIGNGRKYPTNDTNVFKKPLLKIPDPYSSLA